MPEELRNKFEIESNSNLRMNRSSYDDKFWKGEEVEDEESEYKPSDVMFK